MIVKSRYYGRDENEGRKSEQLRVYSGNSGMISEDEMNRYYVELARRANDGKLISLCNYSESW